jgi:hypothetical protein
MIFANVTDCTLNSLQSLAKCMLKYLLQSPTRIFFTALDTPLAQRCSFNNFGSITMDYKLQNTSVNFKKKTKFIFHTNCLLGNGNFVLQQSGEEEHKHIFLN